MKSGVRWWTNSVIREFRASEWLYGLRQRKAKADGVGCRAGPLLRKAREGEHPPVILVHVQGQNSGYTSPLKWPTRLRPLQWRGEELVNNWSKAVIHPLGLAGFALALAFGCLGAFGPSDRWPWLLPVAVVLGAVVLVGGFLLARARTQRQESGHEAKPAPLQPIQQTSGDLSPAIADTNGKDRKVRGGTILRNYIYIDEHRLDSFAEQIRTMKRETVKRGKKVNLSITGLGVELSEEDVWRELSSHEKIENLLRVLTEANLMDTARPQQRMPEEEIGIPKGRQFVLETMLARKVIIPEPHLANTPGIKHLAVWISDPDPTIFSQGAHEWENKGTFVYLTEVWLDDKAGYIYSGCSALQAIANAAQGKAMHLPNHREPLGRKSSDHPVEKLRSIGAIVGDQRTIRSLYLKRCISNEQCYTWNGERRRVNDLLGYPVFIEDASSWTF
jgi:hypothetical protein